MLGGDPVLLVDHEPAVRSVVRFILEKYDIGVIEADSGAAAMERLARGGVRAILLDTMIPDMDARIFVSRGRSNTSFASADSKMTAA